MTKYIIQMIVYTLATTGVLLGAFVVYKKTMQSSPLRKNSLLKIVDILTLPERKNLYVIECENEKFLIGTSANSINLVSKLNNKNSEKKEQMKEEIIEKGFMVSDDRSLFKKLSDKNKDKRGNY